MIEPVRVHAAHGLLDMLFQCGICEKDFAPDDLETHMKTHEAEEEATSKSTGAHKEPSGNIADDNDKVYDGQKNAGNKRNKDTAQECSSRTKDKTSEGHSNAVEVIIQVFNKEHHESDKKLIDEIAVSVEKRDIPDHNGSKLSSKSKQNDKDKGQSEPVQCELCGKEFGTKKKLSCHKRVHKKKDNDSSKSETQAKKGRKKAEAQKKTPVKVIQDGVHIKPTSGENDNGAMASVFPQENKPEQMTAGVITSASTVPEKVENNVKPKKTRKPRTKLKNQNQQTGNDAESTVTEAALNKSTLVHNSTKSLENLKSGNKSILEGGCVENAEQSNEEENVRPANIDSVIKTTVHIDEGMSQDIKGNSGNPPSHLPVCTLQDTVPCVSESGDSCPRKSTEVTTENDKDCSHSNDNEEIPSSSHNDKTELRDKEVKQSTKTDNTETKPGLDNNNSSHIKQSSSALENTKGSIDDLYSRDEFPLDTKPNTSEMKAHKSHIKSNIDKRNDSAGNQQNLSSVGNKFDANSKQYNETQYIKSSQSVEIAQGTSSTKTGSQDSVRNDTEVEDSFEHKSNISKNNSEGQSNKTVNTGRECNINNRKSKKTKGKTKQDFKDSAQNDKTDSVGSSIIETPKDQEEASMDINKTTEKHDTDPVQDNTHSNTQGCEDIHELDQGQSSDSQYLTKYLPKPKNDLKNPTKGKQIQDKQAKDSALSDDELLKLYNIQSSIVRLERVNMNRMLGSKDEKDTIYSEDGECVSKCNDTDIVIHTLKSKTETENLMITSETTYNKDEPTSDQVTDTLTLNLPSDYEEKDLKNKKSKNDKMCTVSGNKESDVSMENMAQSEIASAKWIDTELNCQKDTDTEKSVVVTQSKKSSSQELPTKEKETEIESSAYDTKTDEHSLKICNNDSKKSKKRQGNRGRSIKNVSKNKEFESCENINEIKDKNLMEENEADNEDTSIDAACYDKSNSKIETHMESSCEKSDCKATTSIINERKDHFDSGESKEQAENVVRHSDDVSAVGKLIDSEHDTLPIDTDFKMTTKKGRKSKVYANKDTTNKQNTSHRKSRTMDKDFSSDMKDVIEKQETNNIEIDIEIEGKCTDVVMRETRQRNNISLEKDSSSKSNPTMDLSMDTTDDGPDIQSCTATEEETNTVNELLADKSLDQGDEIETKQESSIYKNSQKRGKKKGRKKDIEDKKPLEHLNETSKDNKKVSIEKLKETTSELTIETTDSGPDIQSCTAPEKETDIVNEKLAVKSLNQGDEIEQKQESNINRNTQKRGKKKGRKRNIEDKRPLEHLNETSKDNEKASIEKLKETTSELTIETTDCGPDIQSCTAPKKETDIVNEILAVKSLNQGDEIEQKQESNINRNTQKRGKKKGRKRGIEDKRPLEHLNETSKDNKKASIEKLKETTSELTIETTDCGPDIQSCTAPEKETDIVNEILAVKSLNQGDEIEQKQESNINRNTQKRGKKKGRKRNIEDKRPLEHLNETSKDNKKASIEKLKETTSELTKSDSEITDRFKPISRKGKKHFKEKAEECLMTNKNKHNAERENVGGEPPDASSASASDIDSVKLPTEEIEQTLFALGLGTSSVALSESTPSNKDSKKTRRTRSMSPQGSSEGKAFKKSDQKWFKNFDPLSSKKLRNRSGKTSWLKHTFETDTESDDDWEIDLPLVQNATLTTVDTAGGETDLNESTVLTQKQDNSSSSLFDRNVKLTSVDKSNDTELCKTYHITNAKVVLTRLSDKIEKKFKNEIGQTKSKSETKGSIERSCIESQYIIDKTNKEQEEHDNEDHSSNKVSDHFNKDGDTLTGETCKQVDKSCTETGVAEDANQVKEDNTDDTEHFDSPQSRKKKLDKQKKGRGRKKGWNSKKTNATSITVNAIGDSSDLCNISRDVKIIAHTKHDYQKEDSVMPDTVSPEGLDTDIEIEYSKGNVDVLPCATVQERTLESDIVTENVSIGQEELVMDKAEEVCSIVSEQVESREKKRKGRPRSKGRKQTNVKQKQSVPVEEIAIDKDQDAQNDVIYCASEETSLDTAKSDQNKLADEETCTETKETSNIECVLGDSHCSNGNISNVQVRANACLETSFCTQEPADQSVNCETSNDNNEDKQVDTEMSLNNCSSQVKNNVKSKRGRSKGRKRGSHLRKPIDTVDQSDMNMDACDANKDTEGNEREEKDIVNKESKVSDEISLDNNIADNVLFKGSITENALENLESVGKIDDLKDKDHTETLDNKHTVDFLPDATAQEWTPEADIVPDNVSIGQEDLVMDKAEEVCSIVSEQVESREKKRKGRPRSKGRKQTNVKQKQSVPVEEIAIDKEQDAQNDVIYCAPEETSLNTAKNDQNKLADEENCTETKETSNIECVSGESHGSNGKISNVQVKANACLEKSLCTQEPADQSVNCETSNDNNEEKQVDIEMSLNNCSSQIKSNVKSKRGRSKGRKRGSHLRKPKDTVDQSDMNMNACDTNKDTEGNEGEEKDIVNKQSKVSDEISLDNNIADNVLFKRSITENTIENLESVGKIDDLKDKDHTETLDNKHTVDFLPDATAQEWTPEADIVPDNVSIGQEELVMDKAEEVCSIVSEQVESREKKRKGRPRSKGRKQTNVKQKQSVPVEEIAIDKEQDAQNDVISCASEETSLNTAKNDQNKLADEENSTETKETSNIECVSGESHGSNGKISNVQVKANACLEKSLCTQEPADQSVTCETSNDNNEEKQVDTEMSLNNCSSQIKSNVKSKRGRSKGRKRGSHLRKPIDTVDQSDMNMDACDANKDTEGNEGEEKDIVNKESKVSDEISLDNNIADDVSLRGSFSENTLENLTLSLHDSGTLENGSVSVNDSKNAGDLKDEFHTETLDNKCNVDVFPCATAQERKSDLDMVPDNVSICQEDLVMDKSVEVSSQLKSNVKSKRGRSKKGSRRGSHLRKQTDTVDKSDMNKNTWDANVNTERNEGEEKDIVNKKSKVTDEIALDKDIADDVSLKRCITENTQENLTLSLHDSGALENESFGKNNDKNPGDSKDKVHTETLDNECNVDVLLGTTAQEWTPDSAIVPDNVSVGQEDMVMDKAEEVSSILSEQVESGEKKRKGRPRSKKRRQTNVKQKHSVPVEEIAIDTEQNAQNDVISCASEENLLDTIMDDENKLEDDENCTETKEISNIECVPDENQGSNGKISNVQIRANACLETSLCTQEPADQSVNCETSNDNNEEKQVDTEMSLNNCSSQIKSNVKSKRGRSKGRKRGSHLRKPIDTVDQSDMNMDACDTNKDTEGNEGEEKDIVNKESKVSDEISLDNNIADGVSFRGSFSENTLENLTSSLHDSGTIGNELIGENYKKNVVLDLKEKNHAEILDNPDHLPDSSTSVSAGYPDSIVKQTEPSSCNVYPHTLFHKDTVESSTGSNFINLPQTSPHNDNNLVGKAVTVTVAISDEKVIDYTSDQTASTKRRRGRSRSKRKGTTKNKQISTVHSDDKETNMKSTDASCENHTEHTVDQTSNAVQLNNSGEMNNKVDVIIEDCQSSAGDKENILELENTPEDKMQTNSSLSENCPGDSLNTLSNNQPDSSTHNDMNIDLNNSLTEQSQVLVTENTTAFVQMSKGRKKNKRGRSGANRKRSIFNKQMKKECSAEGDEIETLPDVSQNIQNKSFEITVTSSEACNVVQIPVIDKHEDLNNDKAGVVNSNDNKDSIQFQTKAEIHAHFHRTPQKVQTSITASTCIRQIHRKDTKQNSVSIKNITEASDCIEINNANDDVENAINKGNEIDTFNITYNTENCQETTRQRESGHLSKTNDDSDESNICTKRTKGRPKRKRKETNLIDKPSKDELIKQDSSIEDVINSPVSKLELCEQDQLDPVEQSVLRRGRSRSKTPTPPNQTNKVDMEKSIEQIERRDEFSIDNLETMPSKDNGEAKRESVIKKTKAEETRDDESTNFSQVRGSKHAEIDTIDIQLSANETDNTEIVIQQNDTLQHSESTDSGIMEDKTELGHTDIVEEKMVCVRKVVRKGRKKKKGRAPRKLPLKKSTDKANNLETDIDDIAQDDMSCNTYKINPTELPIEEKILNDVNNEPVSVYPKHTTIDKVKLDTDVVEERKELEANILTNQCEKERSLINTTQHNTDEQDSHEVERQNKQTILNSMHGINNNSFLSIQDSSREDISSPLCEKTDSDVEPVTRITLKNVAHIEKEVQQIMAIHEEKSPPINVSEDKSESSNNETGTNWPNDIVLAFTPLQEELIKQRREHKKRRKKMLKLAQAMNDNKSSDKKEPRDNVEKQASVSDGEGFYIQRIMDSDSDGSHKNSNATESEGRKNFANPKLILQKTGKKSWEARTVVNFDRHEDIQLDTCLERDEEHETSFSEKPLVHEIPNSDDQCLKTIRVNEGRICTEDYTGHKVASKNRRLKRKNGSEMLNILKEVKKIKYDNQHQHSQESENSNSEEFTNIQDFDSSHNIEQLPRACNSLDMEDCVEEARYFIQPGSVRENVLVMKRVGSPGHACDVSPDSSSIYTEVKDGNDIDCTQTKWGTNTDNPCSTDETQTTQLSKGNKIRAESGDEEFEILCVDADKTFNAVIPERRSRKLKAHRKSKKCRKHMSSDISNDDNLLSLCDNNAFNQTEKDTNDVVKESTQTDQISAASFVKNDSTPVLCNSDMFKIDNLLLKEVGPSFIKTLNTSSETKASEVQEPDTSLSVVDVTSLDSPTHIIQKQSAKTMQETYRTQQGRDRKRKSKSSALVSNDTWVESKKDLSAYEIQRHLEPSCTQKSNSAKRRRGRQQCSSNNNLSIQSPDDDSITNDNRGFDHADIVSKSKNLKVKLVRLSEAEINRYLVRSPVIKPVSVSVTSSCWTDVGEELHETVQDVINDMICAICEDEADRACDNVFVEQVSSSSENTFTSLNPVSENINPFYFNSVMLEGKGLKGQCSVDENEILGTSEKIDVIDFDSALNDDQILLKEDLDSTKMATFGKNASHHDMSDETDMFYEETDDIIERNIVQSDSDVTFGLQESVHKEDCENVLHNLTEMESLDVNIDSSYPAQVTGCPDVSKIISNVNNISYRLKKVCGKIKSDRV